MLRRVIVCARIESVKTQGGCLCSGSTLIWSPEYNYYYKIVEAKIRIIPEYKNLAPNLEKVICETGEGVYEEVDIGEHHLPQLPFEGLKKGIEVALVMKGGDSFVRDLSRAKVLFYSYSDDRPNIDYPYALNQHLDILEKI